MHKALAVVGKVFYILLNVVLALVAVIQFFAAFTSSLPVAALNGVIVLAIGIHFVCAYKKIKKAKIKSCKPYIIWLRSTSQSFANNQYSRVAGYSESATKAKSIPFCADSLGDYSNSLV